MKILMLSNHYYPHVSGVATSITRTVRNLEKLGHKVRLIVPAFPGFLETNPNIYRVPSYPFRPPLIPLPYPGGSFIEKVVNDFKPDIIHAHQPFMLGRTGLKIARQNTIPFVFTHHAMYEQYVHYAPFLPKNFLQKIVLNRVMRFVNQVSVVIAPSESVAQLLKIRKAQVPVQVIPTGIDPRFFYVTPEMRQATRLKWGVFENEIIIVSYARLSYEKNFRFLLDAFAQVSKQTTLPIRLVIGGDGPARASLESQSEKFNLKNKIIFAGEFPHDEVPALLAGADIFAYPSLSETQGLVTLEALATGLPAVVTDAPGNRDIVTDNICGLIAQPNTEDFATKLLAVIENSDLRARLATNAVPRANEFSEEKMAQKMAILYESLLVFH